MTRPDRAIMTAYYLGLSGVGVSAALGDPAAGMTGALGRGPALLGLALLYLSAGVGGLAARWTRRLTAERTALYLGAAGTGIHAAALMVDGAWTSGARLAVAGLLAVSYGLRITATATAPAQLDQAIRSPARRPRRK